MQKRSPLVNLNEASPVTQHGASPDKKAEPGSTKVMQHHLARIQWPFKYVQVHITGTSLC